MTVLELLAKLRSLDVRLWVEEDRLRVSAPDGVLTAELRAELTARKAELVAFLGQARDAVQATAPPILPAPRDAPLPLSFSQQRLWFLDQLEPGTPFYNVPNAVRLSGRLDVAALAWSINEVVRRHEALRTTFAAVDGQGVQVIAPRLTLDLPLVDLSAFLQTERERLARRLTWQEAEWSFDLTCGPLIRVTLLRLAAQEHILLLTTHHIVSDGWSGLVFVRELAALYPAQVSGQPSLLAELEVQYADFALWQRQWWQEGGLDEQLAYWQRRLAGASTVLELPTDRPRSAAQRFRGASYTFLWPMTLAEELRVLSRRAGVTLFAVLLAAFDVLLHRYSGQEDISVGTFVANRTRRQLEGLIGAFINLLVLRSDLSGEPGFEQLLAQVYAAIGQDYAHQDIPFDKLLEALRPEGERGRITLFRTMLVLQNTPLPKMELPGLTVELLRPERGAQPNSDLDLFLEETAEGLLGIAEYNADLFEEATLARLAGHLRTLLEGVVADPRQRIADLPLLSEGERQQMLVEWNRTGVAYPRRQCVHELLAAQVSRTPDAVAVVCDVMHLSYAEMDRRANQLAHHLEALGVGPGQRVGLCLSRAVEMPLALQGVLKAGGAYVPLDPSYPPERLAFMLADADVAVLLTQERLVAGLPAYEGHVVRLDADWPVIAGRSTEERHSGVTPDDLMYVIYTSGSTGRPKGAGVYQRSFVNLLHWFVKDFALVVEDSVLVISSLSFDLTQKNFYAPLMVGGELHLLPSEYYDPQQILDLVSREGISWLNCTPSASYPLVEQGGEGAFARLRSLRYLFLGGEPISVTRLWRWLEADECRAEVVNTYGPTECADICAAHRLVEAGRFLERTVPIGRAVYNAQLFVLDGQLWPLPVGVVGELCVAGEGVGIGYVNDRELTAAKFVPHPFGQEAGERLYRTGDLARYLGDGAIEFLGRMDHQVKVRGYRIELGEIEMVLRGHEGVAEAVLVAREEVTAGQAQLVAYVVAEPGAEPGAGELRDFLRQQLPEYMLPAAFVQMEALPLTPNGKVDRGALPLPEGMEAGRGREYVAPEGPVEERLAEMGVGEEQVGVYDTFFDLGGYSLLATQVVSRINQAFEIKVSMRNLFEEPTIARLALLIEEILLDQFEAELELV